MREAETKRVDNGRTPEDWQSKVVRGMSTEKE
jgi:hypothetical protein